jgi:hypothetical protein
MLEAKDLFNNNLDIGDIFIYSSSTQGLKVCVFFSIECVSDNEGEVFLYNTDHCYDVKFKIIHSSNNVGDGRLPLSIFPLLTFKINDFLFYLDNSLIKQAMYVSDEIKSCLN